MICMIISNRSTLNRMLIKLLQILSSSRIESSKIFRDRNWLRKRLNQHLWFSLLILSSQKTPTNQRQERLKLLNHPLQRRLFGTQEAAAWKSWLQLLLSSQSSLSFCYSSFLHCNLKLMKNWNINVPQLNVSERCLIINMESLKMMWLQKILLSPRKLKVTQNHLKNKTKRPIRRSRMLNTKVLRSAWLKITTLILGS